MKKYVKPEMFYERFELSEHIADCGWEMNSQSVDKCTADPDLAYGAGTLAGAILQTYVGYKLFASTNGSCTLNFDNEEIYCYHNGTNSTPSVFAS